MGIDKERIGKLLAGYRGPKDLSGSQCRSEFLQCIGNVRLKNDGIAPKHAARAPAANLPNDANRKLFFYEYRKQEWDGESTRAPGGKEFARDCIPQVLLCLLAPLTGCLACR